MFAAEVETHMAALNDGLLALEQNPNESGRSEALMRAAHSIKGAAKLVGLQAAVDVAHVIEDSFVAAREGRLALTSSLVDVLLEGVDLLGRAAQYDVAPEARVSASQVSSTVERIKQASTPQAQSLTASAAPSPPPAPQPAAIRPATVQPTPTAEARVRSIRISGDLDETWASSIHHEIGAVLEERPEKIDFDLAEVTEIAPIGLALLAAAARTAESVGSTIRWTSVPQPFEKLMQAVGLEPSGHNSRTGD